VGSTHTRTALRHAAVNLVPGDRGHAHDLRRAVVLGEAAAATATTVGDAVIKPSEDVVEQVGARHAAAGGRSHADFVPGITHDPQRTGAGCVVPRGVTVVARGLAVTPAQEAEVEAECVGLQAHTSLESGTGIHTIQRAVVTHTTVLAARGQAEA